MKYYKIWFSNGSECTAKLVVDTDQFPLNTQPTAYSRLFSYSEVSKMKRFCMTSLYDSWTEAFHERTVAMDLFLHKGINNAQL